MRYIDDFLVCFQYRSDALTFQDTLRKRLKKFSLELEPNKTRLVEFGRFAHRHAKERGEKLETVYFLGFTHFCTRNRQGNFMVGRKTEKTRFKRSVEKLRTLMRKIRHDPLRKQAEEINQILRGHYAYYGLGGNLYSLQRIYRITETCWRKMLCSRCWKGYVTWEKFNRVKEYYPLKKPKLSLSYSKMQALAVL